MDNSQASCPQPDTQAAHSLPTTVYFDTATGFLSYFEPITVLTMGSTIERAYAAFVKNERFKQTIDLLDDPKQPVLKVVK